METEKREDIKIKLNDREPQINRNRHYRHITMVLIDNDKS